MRPSGRAVVTRAILSVVALCVCAISVFAVTLKSEKLEKQFGGSTGDSVSASPDTSVGYKVSGAGTATTPARAMRSWFVWVMGDSTMEYTTEVSADSSHWYIMDRDTCPAGRAEISEVFSTGLMDSLFVRVILYSLTGAAPYGVAFVAEDK